MEQLPGSLGTSGSLALRLGQAGFASASLFFMCFDAQFYSYSVFCFLVTVMGLVIPWSLTLAMADGISIVVRRSVHHRQQQVMTVSFVVLGDWVVSYMSLAASSAAASVTRVMLDSHGFCDRKQCSRYEASAAMALLSWFLSVASSLLNFWLLRSV